MGSKNREKAEESLERALCSTSTELHLQQYPVFHLAPKKPEDNRITFSETTRENGAVLTREWAVYVHPDFGWPGEHEAEVWRAIEHIVHLQRMAGSLENPIATSLSEIRKYMSGSGRGGQDLERIKRALSCLRSTAIKTTFFYHSGIQVRKDLEFNLITSIEYEEKKLANGRKVIDRVSIELPEKVFENIQNLYLRPIDKGFRDDLNKWISKRLYELLGVKFFALRGKRGPYRTKYSRLCALIGVTRQPRLSWARRVLGRAHRELQRSEFLRRVEWFPVRGKDKDWVLHYWPGVRAQAEWNKAFWKEVRVPAPLFVESLPETDSEPVWVEELKADETEMTADLVSDRPPPEEIPPGVINAQDAWKEGTKGQRGAASRYARQALEAFERATGQSRRLPRLSKAERHRLAAWQEAGVRVEDIERGVAEAVVAEQQRATRTGMSALEIWSLDYCAGHVMDAFAARTSSEKEEENAGLQEEEAMHRVRQVQSTRLQSEEIDLKARLKSDERVDSATYERLFAGAVLIEKEKSAVLLVRNREAQAAVQPWRRLLDELVGMRVDILRADDWANHYLDLGRP